MSATVLFVRQILFLVLIVTLTKVAFSLPFPSPLKNTTRSLKVEHNDYLSFVLEDYLDNNALEKHLKGFVSRCKSISKLVEIGRSVDGEKIWALEISNAAGQSEAEPNVKLVGNVHGNEPVGRVLTLGLAEWLCANYVNNKLARRIVDDLHLWLVPAMNPDGFAANKRENTNNIDLNRDFPDHFQDPTCTPTGREQPETKAMMEWIESRHFVSSIAFHEGALVVNYPWDGTENSSTYYNGCPDDATFRYISSLYSKAHPKMATPANSEFPNGGITNGAQWYPVYGSMQDWNYVRSGCLEVTVEVNGDKRPDKVNLRQLFSDHLGSILSFVEGTAFAGLRGIVSVETTSLRKDKGIRATLPVQANVTVEGSNMIVKSTVEFGDFYRPLAPGKYTITVQKEGYTTLCTNVTIPRDGRGVSKHLILRMRKPSEPQSRRAVSLSLATQPHYALVLLFLGGVIVWGLWVTHKRIVHRHLLTRQRSV